MRAGQLSSNPAPRTSNLHRNRSHRLTAGAAVAAIALCELGARTGLPGINGDALLAYFRSLPGGLLVRLYNSLAGGALGRGALLALGVVPYVSARIILQLSRIAMPDVAEQWDALDDRQRSKWTQVFTGGLALVQSYGFARFVQQIPGVVANPGPGFMLQTMLVLTGGAVGMAWLGERITAPDDDALPTLEQRSADTARPGDDRPCAVAPWAGAARAQRVHGERT